jgi:hypothetical protein
MATRAKAGKEGAVKRYPRLQKAQSMLSVLHRTITEAERQGDPQVMVWLARGGGEAKVELTYWDQGALSARRINLAEELGLGVGQMIGLFKWTESEGYIRPNYGGRSRDADVVIASLEHLESKGYELIGELPDPQERLAIILDAAIQAVRRDQSLAPAEQKRRIDLFEEAKIVVRTLGIEVAKAVWRGELPPM